MVVALNFVLVLPKKIGRSEKFSSPPPIFCAKHHAYFSSKSIDGPQKRNVMIELKILIVKASYCGFCTSFHPPDKVFSLTKIDFAKKLHVKFLVFRGFLQ